MNYNALIINIYDITLNNYSIRNGVPMDMMKESGARDFAIDCHKGMLYGNRDYSFHLKSVVAVARKFNLDDDIITSCWLHDTIEDCPVTYQDIKKRFGSKVADIVYAVTDELGRNRKERKDKTYPKIRSNESAVCVKLCDRLANVDQALLDNNTKLLKMYMQEQDEFKKQLYAGDQNPKTLRLWEQLDLLMKKVHDINPQPIK